MSDLAVQQLERRKQKQTVDEDLFPATIEIRGLTEAPIPCAGGILRELIGSMSLGPVLPENEVGFRVRKELLPGVPETKTRLTFNGVDYLITRVINPPQDVAYTIGCDNLNKT